MSREFDEAYERDCEREPDRLRFAPLMDADPGPSLARCTIETHEAIKADPVAWSELGPAKYMPAYDDSDDFMVLTLRTCRCGSTLAKQETPATDAALEALRRAGLL